MYLGQMYMKTVLKALLLKYKVQKVSNSAAYLIEIETLSTNIYIQCIDTYEC